MKTGNPDRGSKQRAGAGADDNGKAKRFAIYAGDGIYLRSLSKAADGRHSFGRDRDRARSYARETAVAALHVVRRAGRAAWIVPHPGCAS